MTGDAHEFLNILLNDLVDILLRFHYSCLYHILEKEAAKGPAESVSPPQKIVNGLHGDQSGEKPQPLAFFDDENVEMIEESAIQNAFGSAQEYASNTDHGYILFYESANNPG
ncbi:hypothetical protein L1987_74278 [Smallanthus sonchifolius]|uniref:Uncharacterized protein n=1 Tax=Smallanthus sonchifolius TaxID=185202 RepID=A0ACB9A2W6_9ASTR|nr:hypothetical protein L1987_74278 [Smallanthus sonchifolius]